MSNGSTYSWTMALAQLVEILLLNPEVNGLNPSLSSFEHFHPLELNSNKEKRNWTVVLAQSVEWSLPTPEVRSLNPVIGKKLYLTM